MGRRTSALRRRTGKLQQAAAGAAACKMQELDRADLGRLRTLAPLCNHELYALALLQGLEAVALNFREMSKQILATIIGGDEAKTFCIVEPLDDPSCHENSVINEWKFRRASHGVQTIKRRKLGKPQERDRRDQLEGPRANET